MEVGIRLAHGGLSANNDLILDKYLEVNMAPRATETGEPLVLKLDVVFLINELHGKMIEEPE